MESHMNHELEFHPPHIYAQNAVYFLTGSTLRHQRFLAVGERRLLLHDILDNAIEDYGVTLYAWVILADHYHLLIKIGDVAPLWKFIKRFHGESAIRLNKLDQTPGRQVWYQYWDRFPRNDKDFWSYFNYIHINPIKHRYVQVQDGSIISEGRQLRIQPGQQADVHACLAAYPYSSYSYYVDTYGEEFMTDVWMKYPIPDYIEHDDF
jgi:putative transposase